LKIVDYGSGRGYLGVQLAHDYKRNILGIESCEATVHSGERRRELLVKYHKDLSENQHYRTTSTLVDRETNFEDLYYQTFQSTCCSFLLCGLHACGALSCSLLHHFVDKPSVHALVNVACCYHLLDEKFVANPFTRKLTRTIRRCRVSLTFVETDRFDEHDSCSFPLSRRLIDERTQLGRNARMLAVQSFERNQADEVTDRRVCSICDIRFHVHLSIDIERWPVVSCIDASHSC
jgi:hypothetical protein